MAYLQIKLHLTESDAEYFGERLTELGAQAVTFVDTQDDPIFEPELGTLQYWPNTTVIGLFAEDDDTLMILAAVQHDSRWQASMNIDIEILEERVWEREWMAHFKPMRFGQRLWVVPSNLPAPEPEAVNLMLDPGLAFGTGTHATTALCLRWLDAQNLEGQAVLDFGCGSGILGIAALKLGAQSCTGIDIDPQALQATADNAARNQVADQIQVFLPGAAPTEKFAVICANILAGPLTELRDIILSHAEVGSKLILSGILQTQADRLIAHYGERCTIDAVQQEGDWVAIACHFNG